MKITRWRGTMRRRRFTSYKVKKVLSLALPPRQRLSEGCPSAAAVHNVHFGNYDAPVVKS